MNHGGWFNVSKLEVTIDGRKQVFTDVKVRLYDGTHGNDGYGSGGSGGGGGAGAWSTITVNPGITYASGGTNWAAPASHTVVRGTAWGGGGGGGAGGHVTYHHHAHSHCGCPGLGTYFPAGDGWYTHPTLERK